MTTLHVAARASWSVGRANLIVSDGRGRVRTLDYPEAAVWDLLSRGYDFDAIAELTRHIAGMSAADARQFVGAMIEAWRLDGLLEER